MGSVGWGISIVQCGDGGLERREGWNGESDEKQGAAEHWWIWGLSEARRRLGKHPKTKSGFKD